MKSKERETLEFLQKLASNLAVSNKEYKEQTCDAIDKAHYDGRASAYEFMYKTISRYISELED